MRWRARPASIVPDKTTILSEKVFSPGSGETILIIEDEVGVRAIIRMFLESQGYSVLTAECGPVGLALYRQNSDSVQVVIIDARMPGMDGVEVMWALREINPEVRIVVISGIIGAAGRFPEEARSTEVSS